PSPAGSWSVRLDGGRVLASGTEEGAETPGEIVAGEQRADWTAPGGEGVAQVAAFTARIGIDGEAMVVTNESGQLLAYELADGANTWTLPLSSPEAQVRGTLEAGTAVVLDEVERERPLAPRSTRRLRIIDASSGEVRLEARVAGEVGAVHAVGGGRALVTVGGQTLLLGACRCRAPERLGPLAVPGRGALRERAGSGVLRGRAPAHPGADDHHGREHQPVHAHQDVLDDRDRHERIDVVPRTVLEHE